MAYASLHKIDTARAREAWRVAYLSYLDELPVIISSEEKPL